MSIAARISSIAIGISRRLGAGFWPGVVISSSGASFDNGGSITSPGIAIERDCFVQLDEATSEMRRAEGYAEGDVRLLVLSGSLSGALSPDMRVRISDGPHVGFYSIRSAILDVAASHWDCRGRPELNIAPLPAGYVPSLDFSDARNSQFIPLVAF